MWPFPSTTKAFIIPITGSGHFVRLGYPFYCIALEPGGCCLSLFTQHPFSQLRDGPFGLIGSLVSYSHAVGDDRFFALDEGFSFA